MSLVCILTDLEQSLEIVQFVTSDSLRNLDTISKNCDLMVKGDDTNLSLIS